MAYPKGVSSGRCTVCRHPQCTRIEILVLGGASDTAVAEKFSLTKFSVGRHMRNHVSTEKRAMLQIGRVHQAALASRVAEEASSVIEMHRVTRSALLGFLSTCVSAGDASTGANVAGRLTEVNTAIARITGELANSPLISHNSVTFSTHPQYNELEAILVSALQPFPDAQRAVLTAIRAMEDRHADAQEQPPRLEAPSIIKAELLS